MLSLIWLTLAFTLALGSLAAVAVRPSPSLAADARPPKIAVVDLQRAVLETEDGLRAFGNPAALVLRLLRRHEFRLLRTAEPLD